MAPSKKEEIETLKVSISILSELQPLSNTLSSVLEKNFKLLNQCEAYEVLRYLVNACMKEKRLKFVDEKMWKNLDKDSKMTVEKFKKDILDAVKHISMEHKTYIPAIKKSELMLPSSPNVFKCFLALSSYALSFQHSLMGIEFWPELEKPTRAGIISRYEEIMEMQNKQLEMNKQIEMMRHDFNELQKKVEIVNIAETIIHSSPNVSADVLRDPKLRIEYNKNLSKEADDRHEKNKKCLELLQRCDEQVNLLIKFIENYNGKIVIDGKDLIPLISYETQVFAEKEEIQLFENGSLCLQGLLSVPTRTLAQRKALPSNMSKILELKSKVDCCTDSKAKLEQIEKSLRLEITERRCKLEQSANGEEARNWMKTFFVPIPELNFNRRCEPLTVRDPVIDLEELDKLIEIRIKQENKEGHIPKFQVPRANSSVRGLRRRSISADRIGFSFFAKAESTRYLRDQQSFKNSKLSPRLGKSLLDLSFRSTSVSKVMDESAISSIENVLSPTSRRIQEMNISGEQTISPIPHVSRKNSVFSCNEDFTCETKPRDSDAASSISFSSPFSLIESSINDTRDTWDISSRDMPSLSGNSSSEED